MFQFVTLYISSTLLKHSYFAHLFFSRNLRYRPRPTKATIIDSRIFSKHVQRPAEVYMYHSLKMNSVALSAHSEILGL